MTRLALVVLAALVTALAAVSEVAQAGTRHALVIGADVGAPDMPHLRYAERDAQRMAEVLQRLGDVAPERVVLLQAPVANDVMRALDVIARRMQAGDELVLYYSGHADRAALHLSESTLPYATLKPALRALPGALTVVLVDACRAGGLVTTRGASVFTLEAEPSASAFKGLAILTASSEDEDAQESDRLGGGVFTHHLLAGLQGAADTSRDGAVTLLELQSYAYAQTLSTTAGSDVVQHPVFAFDLAGHTDPIMARVDLAHRGLLVFDSAGHYLVNEADGQRALLAELRLASGASLALLPGVYRVRRLGEDAAAEARFVVTAGARTSVAAAALSAVPFRHAVRRGYGQPTRLAWSVGPSVEAFSQVLEMTGMTWAGALGAQLDLPALALEARVRYGRGGADTRFVAFTQQFLGLDVGLYHLFDVGPHGVGFGVRVGVDWLAQSFETHGAAPAVDVVVPRTGPFVRLEIALGGDLALTLDAGVEVYFVPMEKDGNVAATSSMTAALGLRVRVP